VAEQAHVGVVRFGATTSRRRRHERVPRPHKVTARLSDEEMQALLANAAAARLAVGAYLAEAGVAPLVPDPRTGGDPEAGALLIELMGVHRQVRGAANNLNQVVAKLHSLGEVPGELAAAAEYLRRVAGRVDAVVAAIAARTPGRR
jgi:hypothetical protein